jgi:hypothetical protein
MVPPSNNPTIAKVKPSSRTPARAAQASKRNQNTGSKNEINHEAQGNQIGLSSTQINTTNATVNTAGKLGLTSSHTLPTMLPGMGWCVMVELLMGWVDSRRDADGKSTKTAELWIA